MISRRDEALRDILYRVSSCTQVTSFSKSEEKSIGADKVSRLAWATSSLCEIPPEAILGVRAELDRICAWLQECVGVECSPAP